MASQWTASLLSGKLLGTSAVSRVQVEPPCKKVDHSSSCKASQVYVLPPAKLAISRPATSTV
jgi:hypothetical protein